MCVGAGQARLTGKENDPSSCIFRVLEGEIMKPGGYFRSGNGKKRSELKTEKRSCKILKLLP